VGRGKEKEGKKKNNNKTHETTKCEFGYIVADYLANILDEINFCLSFLLIYEAV
jgi:hypothetical protein